MSPRRRCASAYLSSRARVAVAPDERSPPRYLLPPPLSSFSISVSISSISLLHLPCKTSGASPPPRRLRRRGQDFFWYAGHGEPAEPAADDAEEEEEEEEEEEDDCYDKSRDGDDDEAQEGSEEDGGREARYSEYWSLMQAAEAEAGAEAEEGGQDVD